MKNFTNNIFNRASYISSFKDIQDIKMPLLFVGVFLASCFLALFAFWDDRSFVSVSYHSLSLGMDMDTVEYVAGKPSYLLAGEEVKNYEKEKKADKYFNGHLYKIWKYQDGVIIVFNQQNKVIKISCYGSVEKNNCEPLYGFKIGDPEDLLIGKLGDDYESRIEDGKKYVFYSTLNSQFDLEKKKIVGLELTDFSDFVKK
jgi:hypothetical protein